jgi:hypothetical protein
MSMDTDIAKLEKISWIGSCEVASRILDSYPEVELVLHRGPVQGLHSG